MKQLILGVFLIGFFSSAAATPVGPVYPAPGGNDWSSTGAGSPADGTAVWNYSNFDTSAFDSLYFGLDQVTHGPAGAGLHYVANPFVFQGVTGTTATWLADTIWRVHDSPTGDHIAAQTRLSMTVTGLGSDPWTTDLASIGLDDTGTFGLLGAVVDNSAGLDFELAFRIEANVGSGWEPLNRIRQHIDHDGATRSSIATGFYYTEAINPVPIPAALPLLMSALGGLGFMKWRSRRQRC